MSYKRPPPQDDRGALSRPFKLPIAVTRNELRKTRRIINYDDESGVPLREVSVNRGPDIDPKKLLDRQFKPPLLDKRPESTEPPALGMTRKKDWIPRPLHDPCGEFAIVLYDPTVEPIAEAEEQLIASQKLLDESSQEVPESPQPDQAEPKTGLSGPSLASLLGLDSPKKTEQVKVPVVIDPRLSKILRPHQVDGVKFLYNCTMGFVDPRVYGCIMADEMGLGKTLQCITLMWTLLKQSPEGGKGSIEKCVVVCPSSLVNNWANELDKWLGKGALRSLVADGKSVKSADLVEALRAWARAEGRQVTQPVLIISYETLRRNTEELNGAEIGLLLADEGHRLKNGDSLTFTALDSLNAKRRVILSGTPIQNDLSEYFSLLSFAIPGLLGSRLDFRKNYENAIIRGRDAYATDQQMFVGEQKLQELLHLVNKYIIRRTNDILSKYLPVKYEHVVFCELSDFQKKLYQHLVQEGAKKSSDDLLTKFSSQPLNAINILKKICNHPDLVDLDKLLRKGKDILPAGYHPPGQRGRDREIYSWYSGKFMVLERMLARIRADTNDKIVIISNYTQTLDLVEKVCRLRKYGLLRLDGTMAIAKRQKLVDRFNDPDTPEFIFLLSSKAGGCGINLIGANRLILLDPDWNPAADQQALARVWRDGQKKHCFVYRFIATGTIEEKIYQRQSMKQSLSSCVVDENTDVERLFSFDDLRRLFKYNTETICETHDTFKCKRCTPLKQTIGAQALLYGDATTWNHYPKSQLAKIEDKLLQQEASEDVVSFVFQYISH
ncbi:DNA repair protein rhp54 [Wickerhamiella sorbophila]|uniref:DNA repair protein rhp54 n=1 Tax=Wickerhamiella sorbophila TaxID=45607 RepID=A0A2T0FKF3_9ASCO|nr:DNA repair protein rhp54 [Wickerhamiella sorbophila]PRT55460.1 DNA repair protein rhp54 [Wickerhamiella sorbophila]